MYKLMACTNLTKKVIFGGVGICSMAHLTRQVEGAIKSADIVLHLVKALFPNSKNAQLDSHWHLDRLLSLS